MGVTTKFMSKKIFFIFSVICMGFLYASPDSKTVLIFGGNTGWFGQKIIQILDEQGHKGIGARSRLENREEIIRELEEVKPDFIINAAGVTGRPNIDWCEDHKEDTIRANIIGCLNLADIAWQRGIHLTNIGTGCLYDYDEEHPKGSGSGFTEEDEPNHFTSFYCESKVYLEKLLLRYDNVLNLRVRMPVSFDFHPRNFIIKITTYERVINEPNSLSVLEDLLPIAVDMTLKGRKGNYNFANPGSISHNEILDLYRAYIDKDFTYQNFTVEEQDKILKAGRSNCELDVSKLLQEYPNIPSIKDSILRAIQEMQKDL